MRFMRGENKGKIYKNCKKIKGWHWWLTPVILATQEAELRKTRVQASPGQIVCGTLSQKTQDKRGLLVEWLK
jgi:hypothetical protein